MLTNEATFRGHTPLRGASAFLIKAPRGLVIAATAKHLIGENGGVEPEIPVRQLNHVLQTWRMYPRTLPDQIIEVDQVAVEGLDRKDWDWLLLAVKGSPKRLSATPLRLRPSAVDVGEKVYLIGCPYEEQHCKQNVYSGTIVQRGRVDRFRFELDTPVDIRGFSGAPIVDANGHLVGVMTVWFQPRMRGEKFLEAGGEDATSVLSLLNE